MQVRGIIKPNTSPTLRNIISPRPVRYRGRDSAAQAVLECARLGRVTRHAVWCFVKDSLDPKDDFAAWMQARQQRRQQEQLQRALDADTSRVLSAAESSGQGGGAGPQRSSALGASRNNMPPLVEEGESDNPLADVALPCFNDDDYAIRLLRHKESGLSAISEGSERRDSSYWQSNNSANHSGNSAPSSGRASSSSSPSGSVGNGRRASAVGGGADMSYMAGFSASAGFESSAADGDHGSHTGLESPNGSSDHLSELV